MILYCLSNVKYYSCISFESIQYNISKRSHLKVSGLYLCIWFIKYFIYYIQMILFGCFFAKEGCVIHRLGSAFFRGGLIIQSEYIRGFMVHCF